MQQQNSGYEEMNRTESPSYATGYSDAPNASTFSSGPIGQKIYITTQQRKTSVLLPVISIFTWLALFLLISQLLMRESFFHSVVVSSFAYLGFISFSGLLVFLNILYRNRS